MLHATFDYDLLRGDDSYMKMTIETKIDLNGIYQMTPTLVILCVLVAEKMHAKCQKRQFMPKNTQNVIFGLLLNTT